MKHWLIGAGLMLLATLAGAPYFFRGGEVLAAELSERKIEILDFEPARFPELPERRVYAAVSFRFPAGRKLALTDFEIVAFDRAYPCVAVRVGNATRFSGKPTEITPKPDEVYTLLFVLDRAFAGLDDREKLVVRCAYPQGEAISARLTFTNRRHSAFSPVSLLPTDGTF